MKILHIVSGDLSGSAARGAYWLHQRLDKLGVESKVLTNSKTTPPDEDKVITTSVDMKSKVINAIRRKLGSWPDWMHRRRERIIFSTGYVGFDFTKLKEYKEAVIVHLHWVKSW